MKWQQILGLIIGAALGMPQVGLGIGSLASGDASNAVKSVTGSFSGENKMTGELSNNSGYSNANQILLDVQNGKITALEAYNLLAQYFPNVLAFNPNIMKMLNQLMARENTANAQDYERENMQNGLLWNASQLQQLGLSNSGVLSTGASIPNVAPAQTDFSNPAQDNLNRLQGFANSMISMAGRMASSGIYGSALQAVKGTAKRFSFQVAHTAPKVVKNFVSSKTSRMSWDDLLDDLDAIE